ncbi:MAG: Rid family hydrolase, partial [Bacteroidota bacterium]|nr:Rid family hydrolase [Bacteroidota bacterium]
MVNTIINSTNAPAPIGPYSQAVLANNVLYVSGQIAIDPATDSMVLNDIEAETHRVMQNLQAILSEAGLNFTNVVKCTIFV